MSHIERRQREKEATKNKIMDAALKIAKSEGWNAVTIRKIANAIEYTAPIVYEYFKNKEDLLNALVDQGHMMLNKKFNSVISIKTEPREVLLLLSLTLWDFAFKNKELYQLMFSLDSKMPDVRLQIYLKTMKFVFNQLTDNETSVVENIFSWMCFQQGYIYSIKLMRLPADLLNNDPRELFERAMKKYISNI